MTDVAARPRRSYSRLDTYQQCPEMYKHKYVGRVPEEPSVWSVGGTAFHAVAEQYLRGDLPDDADLLFAAWTEAWYAAREEVATDLPIDKWRAANRGQENAAWWIENGYDMVRRFVRWKRTTGKDLLVFDHDGQPALEQQVHVELGGVPIIAIPDAVVVDEHGQLGILDYKTGKPPKKPTQLRVYAAALAAAWDVHATWGLYYMARPGQLLANDLTRHPHSEVVDWFVEFDERERAGDYTPTPGDPCKFCAYKRDLCSFYNPENS